MKLRSSVPLANLHSSHCRTDRKVSLIPTRTTQAAKDRAAAGSHRNVNLCEWTGPSKRGTTESRGTWPKHLCNQKANTGGAWCHGVPGDHGVPPRPRTTQEPTPGKAAVLHSLVWVSAPPPVLVLFIHVDRGCCAVHRELGIINLRRREGRDQCECSAEKCSACPGSHA